MIPVSPQPEPATFDRDVRQPGLVWLRKRELDLDQPLPAKTELEPYWRKSLDDMHRSYSGCCAYLAVFFERLTGAGSVDHVLPKSLRPGLAYEWSNYRLACSRMNSRKGILEEVLDPFEVEPGWFRLELVSGRIFPNAKLPEVQQKKIELTIKRLHLDDSECRELRARHYQEYREGLYTKEFLKKYSPFVWFEANRQGLL